MYKYLKYVFLWIIAVSELFATNKFVMEDKCEAATQSQCDPILYHYCVSDASEIVKILKQHNLTNAFIAFDFDDTIAQSISIRDEKTYYLLPSLDLFRTYQSTTEQAIKSIEHSRENMIYAYNKAVENNQYILLDNTMPHCIRDLRTQGASISICSGRSYDSKKGSVVSKVGLNKDDYYSGKSKADIILNSLNSKKFQDKQFDTVVLIDNSYYQELYPFQVKMEELIPTLNCARNVKKFNIVTIEYKKFTDQLNVEKLVSEMQGYFQHCETDNEVETDDEELNFSSSSLSSSR